VIEEFLDLHSNPNTVYSNRKILYHILNASTTQTTIQVSKSGYKAPAEDIRYRLRNLDDVQDKLNS